MSRAARRDAAKATSHAAAGRWCRRPLGSGEDVARKCLTRVVDEGAERLDGCLGDLVDRLLDRRQRRLRPRGGLDPVEADDRCHRSPIRLAHGARDGRPRPRSGRTRPVPRSSRSSPRSVARRRGAGRRALAHRWRRRRLPRVVRRLGERAPTRERHEGVCTYSAASVAGGLTGAQTTRREMPATAEGDDRRRAL